MIAIIRRNSRWEITTNENEFIIYDNDQFIEYIRNLSTQGLDTNNEEQLRDVLYAYNMLESELGYYFIRNRREIDRRRRIIIARLNNWQRYITKDTSHECHAFCFCPKG